MVNQELAKIFYELADFLSIEAVPFKPQAYQRAALGLETFPEDVREIYKRGGQRAIEEIPGVGKSIAEKIAEYLKTGKIKYYQQYKKKYPFNMQELTAVEGIGPKTAQELYKHLQIKKLKDLEKAAKQGKIRRLPNFGEKTERNILQGVRFLKRSKGRFLLGEILPKVREIEGQLKQLEEVERIEVAGSVRRRKETIGDVDFLVIARSPEKVMDFFCSLPGVIKVWVKGPTRSSVRLKDGFDVDLRVVSSKSYGAALQYFSGSKEHNIKLREIAIKKGYKLNEYGLFKGSKMIASITEEKIYKVLGLAYPAPEIREDRGEIELAQKNSLPQLVELKDIKGDLHCHSVWDGGQDSIEEMAQAAIGLGYEYLGIADHTEKLTIEQGLTEQQFQEQRKEINNLNSKSYILNSKFRILQGCEANIMADGSLDISDAALQKLDYAIAGVHSQFKMSKKEMTERMLKAMKNPYVKIISHLSGRLLKKRDEYQIDLGKILRAAKETKTVLEVNSSPLRLDLSALNVKRALEAGVLLAVNSDSHQKEQLGLMEYGVAQARRGWASAKDIINTCPWDKALQLFK